MYYDTLPSTYNVICKKEDNQLSRQIIIIIILIPALFYSFLYLEVTWEVAHPKH